MNKYKETRRLSASTLRALCVREDWYTRGDNDEYDHLLLDLAGNKPHLNTGDIIAIAEDIAAHSKLKEGWTIEAIAFEVARACTVTFQQVPVVYDEQVVAARRALSNDLIKIKAVLEATKCTKPDDIAKIPSQLDQYILDPGQQTYEDIAVSDLIAIAGEPSLDLLVPHLNLDGYGRAVAEKMNIVLTAYGAVSRRDCQPVQTFSDDGTRQD